MSYIPFSDSAKNRRTEQRQLLASDLLGDPLVFLLLHALISHGVENCARMWVEWSDLENVAFDTVGFKGKSIYRSWMDLPLLDIGDAEETNRMQCCYSW